MRSVRRTPMLPYFVPETTPNFQTGEMVIKRALTSWFRNCLIITFFNVLKGFAYSSTNSHLITSSKKLNVGSNLEEHVGKSTCYWIQAVCVKGTLHLFNATYEIE